MKVIWKETIVDKLRGVHDGARRNNKEVECIMLSKREWEELCAIMRPYVFDRRLWDDTASEGTFMGMKIKRWEFA